MQFRKQRPIPQLVVVRVDFRFGEHAGADGGLHPLVCLRQIGFSEILLADSAGPAPLVDFELNRGQRRREAEIHIHQRSSADGHPVLDKDRAIRRRASSIALLQVVDEASLHRPRNGERTALHQHHALAAATQFMREYRACRAGADDQIVDLAFLQRDFLCRSVVA